MVSVSAGVGTGRPPGRRGPGAARMFGRYAAANLRAHLQYRSSFLLEALGQLLIAVAEFLAIWALFERFGSIRGWTLPEVALFYGVVHVVFGVADTVARGFDRFTIHVRDGAFDRVLLRPRSPLLQVLGLEIAPKRIGRLLQGTAVLIWALSRLPAGPTAGDAALLLWSAAGAFAAFFSLFLLTAALTFWSTETLEIINIVSHGGVDATQYPIAVFGRALRYLFLFVVPIGTVTYFPVVAVLGRPDPLQAPPAAAWLAPCAGFAFLALAAGLWRLGVRRYTSTGS